MATRHVFAPHAALIPLLHAARFPHETIIGCLLGTQTSLSSTTLNDDPKASTSREIRYEHAVPLLHHWTGLSAAIEMSLTLVEEYAALKSWTIIGFYFANEGLGEASLDASKVTVPVLVKRLMVQAGSETSFFALDNRNLVSPKKAYVSLASSSTSSSSIEYAKADANPSALPGLMKQGQHLLVEDWDCHLEDIGARWLSNEHVDLDTLTSLSATAGQPEKEKPGP